MYLVFNCGGTNTRIGVSADGEALDKTLSFPTRKSFDQQLEKFETSARELLSGENLAQIAGGIAGVWYADKSKLFRSPNLPDWEKISIKKKMQEMFGVNVSLANDVEMEGLGEATIGAGRRNGIVVYMSIGTGIGGVKIENGRICQRMYGFEPGYQIIDVSGEIGYLENFASGTAMKQIYGKEPTEITDNEAWEKETQLIAVGIHNAIMFWAPEIVILGGSLMNKIDPDNIKVHLTAQMQRLPKLPILALSELKEQAGLYGALRYIKITP